MTEKEFIDIAAELRSLALRTVLSEDIAQDTMLRLWTIHEDLPSGKIHGLTVTIARHLAIDRIRKQRHAPLDSLQDANLAAIRHLAIEDTSLEEKENEEWLHRHLKELPSNEYMVLHLRQVEKKSSEEIAAILGIKQESVPVLLSRARRKLYASLKNKK